MSTKTILETICDICGTSDVMDQKHYILSLKEYSTINCNYLDGKTIHICKYHEGEILPLDKLFDKKMTDND